MTKDNNTELYLGSVQNIMKDVGSQSADKEVKAAVTSAINKINEISKQIQAGSITPQQAEAATQNIVAHITETPGISQSSIAALKKVAAKEDAIAKAKEIAEESTPSPNKDNKPSMVSDLFQKVKDLANKMIKGFKVTTGSSSLGTLHPDPTPKEGLASAKAKKDTKSK